MFGQRESNSQGDLFSYSDIKWTTTVASNSWLCFYFSVDVTFALWFNKTFKCFGPYGIVYLSGVKYESNKKVLSPFLVLPITGV
jgi:hypothetical protein